MNMNPITDTLNRPLRDLRISVTDRCNFRCVYCMPREIFGPGYAFVPRKDLLTLEEIARLARIFAQIGMRKVRITGGEPLIRRNLEHLVEMVSAIDGVDDISLTTNGSMLTARRAIDLKAAGLRRLTVSLDALDDETFKKINDVDYPAIRVLDGIDNARAAGFNDIKVNAVIRRGLNEHAVMDLVEHFRGSGCIVRFIEYMDVGETNGWNLDDVLPAKQLVEQIHARFPLDPVDPNYRGEVAKRWRYRDGAGEVGFITSVTESFCGDCSRARLSAVGQVYTCLFASEGHDLRELLRSGADDDALLSRVRSIWSARDDRYSELRGLNVPIPGSGRGKVEMSHIGG
ncbi:MAG: GTP 3',8-cyclase MoaA [Arenicellales bacterium]|nr:GTP 3',8-cyclase MoaA [Gammaproteobacteria bacterium]NDG44006.1 GTP 3',8-cyclase MoaA [Gammaproteobacteria bacterium]